MNKDIIFDLVYYIRYLINSFKSLNLMSYIELSSKNHNRTSLNEQI